MTFQNIFSKTPEKISLQNPKTPIIVDTREKQSLISANLIEQNAFVNFEHLEIGDYLISNIIIERKTISDFIQSMINKRLFHQLQEIKKYPEYLLLIEGEKEIPEKFEKPFKGLILSIITKHKVPIIFTKDEKETAENLNH